MNLLQTKWLLVRRRDGSTELIRPGEITSDISNNPIVDIEAPRPDLRLAAVEFVIGLLQSSNSGNANNWRDDYRNPPSPDVLSQRFEPLTPAFNLDGEAPRFMQDAEIGEVEAKPVAAMFIDAPTGSTLKKNTDHFIKRGGCDNLSPAAAALSLYCLQLMAPAGGRGYRTGLRGGGPLTTLVLAPQDGEALPPLWATLWLNVLPRDTFLNHYGNAQLTELGDRFPWLKGSRISDKKGSGTFPQHCHPDQVFWAMPRRMWLNIEDNPGRCDLSQQQSDRLVSSFDACSYGTNYEGAWRHPLSPYNKNTTGEWLPQHPQPGGIYYRHWLGLALGSATEEPAHVVSAYPYRNIDGQCRLWAGGYDMDNAKARCWYEATMPLYALPKSEAEVLADDVSNLVEGAKLVASYLRGAVKDAWFRKGMTVRGDLSAPPDALWHATETAFFEALHELVNLYRDNSDAGPQQTQPIFRAWHNALQANATRLFEVHAASGADPRRVSRAYNSLRKQLYGPKLLTTTLKLPKLEKARAA